jgi:hypothetical protein
MDRINSASHGDHSDCISPVSESGWMVCKVTAVTVSKKL